MAPHALSKQAPDRHEALTRLKSKSGMGAVSTRRRNRDSSDSQPHPQGDAAHAPSSYSSSSSLPSTTKEKRKSSQHPKKAPAPHNTHSHQQQEESVKDISVEGHKKPAQIATLIQRFRDGTAEPGMLRNMQWWWKQEGSKREEEHEQEEQPERYDEEDGSKRSPSTNGEQSSGSSTPWWRKRSRTPGSSTSTHQMASHSPHAKGKFKERGDRQRAPGLDASFERAEANDGSSGLQVAVPDRMRRRLFAPSAVENEDSMEESIHQVLQKSAAVLQQAQDWQLHPDPHNAGDATTTNRQLWFADMDDEEDILEAWRRRRRNERSRLQMYAWGTPDSAGEEEECNAQKSDPVAMITAEKTHSPSRSGYEEPSSSHWPSSSPLTTGPTSSHEEECNAQKSDPVAMIKAEKTHSPSRSGYEEPSSSHWPSSSPLTTGPTSSHEPVAPSLDASDASERAPSPPTQSAPTTWVDSPAKERNAPQSETEEQEDWRAHIGSPERSSDNDDSSNSVQPTVGVQADKIAFHRLCRLPPVEETGEEEREAEFTAPDRSGGRQNIPAEGEDQALEPREGAATSSFDFQCEQTNADGNGNDERPDNQASRDDDVRSSDKEIEQALALIGSIWEGPGQLEAPAGEAGDDDHNDANHGMRMSGDNREHMALGWWYSSEAEQAATENGDDDGSKGDVMEDGGEVRESTPASQGTESVGVQCRTERADVAEQASVGMADAGIDTQEGREWSSKAVGESEGRLAVDATCQAGEGDLLVAPHHEDECVQACFFSEVGCQSEESANEKEDAVCQANPSTLCHGRHFVESAAMDVDEVPLASVSGADLAEWLPDEGEFVEGEDDDSVVHALKGRIRSLEDEMRRMGCAIDGMEPPALCLGSLCSAET